jgi:hypothetical protein
LTTERRLSSLQALNEDLSVSADASASSLQPHAPVEVCLAIL